MQKLLNGELVDMTPEEVASFLAEQAAAEAAQAAYVPRVVSPYQAKVALHRAGYLNTVEALMSNSETPFEAVLAWKNATQFERHSPFINTLGPLLGLSEEAIDDLFRVAGQVV